MKNFVKEGRLATVVATAAVASGSVQVVGAMIGVAENKAAIGEEYELALEGVYALPLDATTETSVGEVVYWDGSAVVDVDGGGANTKLGVVLEAKTAGAGQTVEVRLNGSY